MSDQEVLIVGGGVIGCSIALHLARLGIRSHIVERESIGARASGKSWGIIPYPPRTLPMSGSTPVADSMFATTGDIRRYLDLYWMTYLRMPDMALEIKERAGIDILYGYSPNISAATNEFEEDTLKLGLQAMRAQGYFEAEWLEQADIRSVHPDISPLIRGGLLVHNRQVETYRYSLGLAQAAERMGVTIGSGEVVGFRTAGGRVVAARLASGRELSAGSVVLAMGPWTPGAARWLGQDRPVFLNREQCLVLRLPRPISPYAIRLWSGTQIVPKTDGTIILGHAGVPDPQDGFDVPETTDDVREDLVGTALEILPGLAEAELVGHRGDILGFGPPPVFVEPMLGRLPDWDNVYVAFRFGTMGIMASLGVGESMAELIAAGGQPSGRFKTLLDYLSPANAIY